MSDDTRGGHFVWHDLMTTDVPRAQDFYGRLVGWTITDMEGMEAQGLKLLKAGGSEIGDIVPLDPGEGVPSHWMNYISVEDMDAALAKAVELGGTVVEPAMDTPWGKMALVKDPGGAFFKPFESAQAPQAESWPPAAGSFCWFELMTPDVAKAADFYGALTGWNHEKAVDLPEGGAYYMFKRGGANVAGFMGLPPQVPASYWTLYIAVPDVDAATAEAGEMGATVMVPPQDVPGTGRFSILQDPTGAVFALFTAEPMEG